MRALILAAASFIILMACESGNSPTRLSRKTLATEMNRVDLRTSVDQHIESIQEPQFNQPRAFWDKAEELQIDGNKITIIPVIVSARTGRFDITDRCQIIVANDAAMPEIKIVEKAETGYAEDYENCTDVSEMNIDLNSYPRKIILETTLTDATGKKYSVVDTYVIDNDLGVKYSQP